MLAHQREHELFFLGKMFFQFCFQAGIEMMEAREHFTMMRIMDDEDLVEEFFCFSHGNRIMSAAAVIKMQSIQESNRIRMSFYNVS